jgi:phosphoribosylaminoimidazolecarboxamide formyltransferase / IMP cyclohydrolase
MTAKIKNALVSVYYKDNLEPVIRQLHQLGIKLVSTGGTYDFIKNLGIPVGTVEDLTTYPSILGGRVKTLHPKIFGGILGRRNNPSDVEQMKQYAIEGIDLVIVDLYPFEETVASGAADEDIIEKIDIGGISLIRAAAKNYEHVLIVSSRSQYGQLLDLLKTQNGETTIEQRREFAKKAFSVSSGYDTAIFNYFNGKNDPGVKIDFSQAMSLRYGENPHQQATFYGNFDSMFHKVAGKEISYNNLLDIEAAVNLIDEFSDPTVAILKHNNACGLASRDNLTEAWKEALAGDPVSAYGGIVVANRKIDLATAEEVNKLFYEVLIAPDYDKAALELLTKKDKRILLVDKRSQKPARQIRSLLNGFLIQDADLAMEDAGKMTTVTNITPTAQQLTDLEFALKIVKHSKSNCIVLAKDKKLCASGVGQTSRVDALKQAIEKAASFNNPIQDGAMASDAFFPFADCVEIAHKAGITSVVEPGGSMRDKDSIDYCNTNQMAMVFTGVRHFKH